MKCKGKNNNNVYILKKKKKNKHTHTHTLVKSLKGYNAAWLAARFDSIRQIEFWNSVLQRCLRNTMWNNEPTHHGEWHRVNQRKKRTPLLNLICMYSSSTQRRRFFFLLYLKPKKSPPFLVQLVQLLARKQPRPFPRVFCWISAPIRYTKWLFSFKNLKWNFPTS